MTDRQCPSCGGFCKKSGCERENLPVPETDFGNIPLPQGAVYTHALGTVGAAMWTYTADQMREYAATRAAAAVAQQTETIRVLREALDKYSEQDILNPPEGWADKAMELATNFGVESLRVGCGEVRDSYEQRGGASWKTVDLRERRKAARERLRQHIDGIARRKPNE